MTPDNLVHFRGLFDTCLFAGLETCFEDPPGSTAGVYRTAVPSETARSAPLCRLSSNLPQKCTGKRKARCHQSLKNPASRTNLWMGENLRSSYPGPTVFGSKRTGGTGELTTARRSFRLPRSGGGPFGPIHAKGGEVRGLRRFNRYRGARDPKARSEGLPRVATGTVTAGTRREAQAPTRPPSGEAGILGRRNRSILAISRRTSASRRRRGRGGRESAHVRGELSLSMGFERSSDLGFLPEAVRLRFRAEFARHRGEATARAFRRNERPRFRRGARGPRPLRTGRSDA